MAARQSNETPSTAMIKKYRAANLRAPSKAELKPLKSHVYLCHCDVPGCGAPFANLIHKEEHRLQFHNSVIRDIFNNLKAGPSKPLLDIRRSPDMSFHCPVVGCAHRDIDARLFLDHVGGRHTSGPILLDYSIITTVDGRRQSQQPTQHVPLFMGFQFLQKDSVPSIRADPPNPTTTTTTARPALTTSTDDASKQATSALVRANSSPTGNGTLAHFLRPFPFNHTSTNTPAHRSGITSSDNTPKRSSTSATIASTGSRTGNAQRVPRKLTIASLLNPAEEAPSSSTTRRSTIPVTAPQVIDLTEDTPPPDQPTNNASEQGHKRKLPEGEHESAEEPQAKMRKALSALASKRLRGEDVADIDDSAARIREVEAGIFGEGKQEAEKEGEKGVVQDSEVGAGMRAEEVPGREVDSESEIKKAVETAVEKELEKDLDMAVEKEVDMAVEK
ncbi:hypothetical protein BJ508DRAFT_308275 [Ascobolus immersus RN42]|uniref:C2H2-type domain-containing protein n=1 Tax=Ascobolus immersus RN42 TaxID=1160509 RepID=A0A3N4I072_ASCIM|nr:hypothetical protein BJ508DRAFT_308275 [Ascobolus immersus RN42]